MGIELTPLENACNLECLYCYQNPMRDAGNTKNEGRYDMAAMKAAVERAKPGEQGFTLFGGEPLLLPIADFEELMRFGFERYGKNGVQTNGALITDEHIPLFRRYNVHVGISLDGPGALNDTRWAGSLERTREQTARTEQAIQKLLADGQIPSLIVTLHRRNAIGNARITLMNWLEQLDAQGIFSVRLHALEIESLEVESLGLTAKEQLAVFRAFHAFERKLKHMRFDVFEDIRRLLNGRDETTCVWNGCDPYTTSAVQGIDGQGHSGNCGRTNKDGVRWLKADTPGFERYIALYHTPQEHGGCKDCRFFFACKGECPGTAIGNDWRNRTRDCEVWMALFEQEEAAMHVAGQTPISLDNVRREKLVKTMLDNWSAGRYALPSNRPHGDIPHGDHTDAGRSDFARNGFASKTAMESAHADLMAMLDGEHKPQGLVVDLGAGDGTLLLKISRQFGVRVLGIECEPTDISWILRGNISDVERLLKGYVVDTFIVSERRFEELPSLREYARAHARQVLSYSYDEPRWARVELTHGS